MICGRKPIHFLGLGEREETAVQRAVDDHRGGEAEHCAECASHYAAPIGGAEKRAPFREEDDAQQQILRANERRNSEQQPEREPCLGRAVVARSGPHDEERRRDRERNCVAKKRPAESVEQKRRACEHRAQRDHARARSLRDGIRREFHRAKHQRENPRLRGDSPQQHPTATARSLPPSANRSRSAPSASDRHRALGISAAAY
jgi:hypothetical protein